MILSTLVTFKLSGRHPVEDLQNRNLFDTVIYSGFFRIQEQKSHGLSFRLEQKLELAVKVYFAVVDFDNDRSCVLCIMHVLFRNIYMYSVSFIGWTITLPAAFSFKFLKYLLKR